MKRLVLSTLMLFALAAVVMAQTPVVDYSNKVTTDHVKPDLKLHKNLLKAKSDKAVESRWYNYAFTMDDVLGGIGYVGGNNLFPDTTILVNYSSGYAGPWIHILGNTLDPSNVDFNDLGLYPTEMKINSYMPYTLDSVALHCFYWRNIANPAIVDTLLVEVYTTNNAADFTIGGWTGTLAATYGTDTLRYGRLYFNPSDLSAVPSNKKTYKLPLTEAMANDTLDDGTVILQIATPDVDMVNANQNVVTTFKFIPGYSWIANYDTLSMKNRLYFLSTEESGENTYCTYTKGDWNCSHIAAQDAVFDAASSWYGRQIPKWAYTQPFVYENHWVSYLLTADVTGIKKATENIISLSQNQPNPFSDVTTINYSLNEVANVALELFDQTGRKVMSLNQGIVAPGMHNIQIDAANLQNGIYFYTLTAGNHKASKKMVVLK
jgi:hypothetical protein